MTGLHESHPRGPAVCRGWWVIIDGSRTSGTERYGGTLSDSDIDSVRHFLCANANLRPIFFLLRPFLRDPKNDFVLELAFESRADFLLTFNTRDFARAASASAFE